MSFLNLELALFRVMANATPTLVDLLCKFYMLRLKFLKQDIANSDIKHKN